MIDEINQIIEWYATLPVGYNDVNELMYARQRLTGYLFNYATELGSLRKDWNKAQSVTENARSKIQARELHQGIGKAEIFAKANTSREFKIEKELEGAYFSHRENVEAMKEVLNSLNQSIAIARDEFARKQYQNG
jgi:hypothetical protein